MASDVNFKKLGIVLLEAIPSDLPDALVERWLNHPDTLSKVLHQALEKFPEVVPPRYFVYVNYDLPLEVVIKRGTYDYVDPNITAGNFPSDKSGQRRLTVYLINFDHSISSKNVLVELDRQGLCPITLRVLLALSLKYSHGFGEYPVAALGSIRTSSFLSYSRKCVPCLEKNGLARYLLNHPVDGGWDKDWYFAATRK